MLQPGKVSIIPRIYKAVKLNVVIFIIIFITFLIDKKIKNKTEI
jgi:hypothetical protein